MVASELGKGDALNGNGGDSVLCFCGSRAAAGQANEASESSSALWRLHGHNGLTSGDTTNVLLSNGMHGQRTISHDGMNVVAIRPCISHLTAQFLPLLTPKPRSFSTSSINQSGRTTDKLQHCQYQHHLKLHGFQTIRNQSSLHEN